LWRDRDHEIDILVTQNNDVVCAFECKSGTDFDKTSIRAFRTKFPNVPLFVVSLIDKLPRRTELAEIVPWRDGLLRFKSLAM
jgi:hypothetical protein